MVREEVHTRTHIIDGLSSRTISFNSLSNDLFSLTRQKLRANGTIFT